MRTVSCGNFEYYCLWAERNCTMLQQLCYIRLKGRMMVECGLRKYLEESTHGVIKIL
jgi:hypothetical protein